MMMQTPLDWCHHNLHTGKVSMRLAADKRRTTHAEWVVVDTATPHVSQAGRERVLRLRVRMVHATIRGTVIASGPNNRERTIPLLGRRISYNPHRDETFIYSDDGSEWSGSARVLITGGYAYEVTP